MKKKQLFTLRDSEDELVGLLTTDMNFKVLRKEWRDFYDNAPIISVLAFVDSIKKEFKDNSFEINSCISVTLFN